MTSKRTLAALTVAILTFGLLAASVAAQDERKAAEPLLKAQKNEEAKTLDVFVKGELFTSYKYDHIYKKPYFYPVVGPKSGKSVTVESGDLWPHHNSLFFGCDKVNGGNYWAMWKTQLETGQILSQDPKIEKASGDEVVLSDVCLWKKPEEDPIIRETCRVAITAPSDDLRFMDFTFTFTPLTEITIKRSNHSLFCGRMTQKLSVEGGGILINAEGDVNEKGTFGVNSPWCDYFGHWDSGIIEGMAIFQNPNNPEYPTKWFTRDYGFFSPTNMYWLEGDEIKIPEGDVVTLKYRVVVHNGGVKKAGIADLFKQYEAESGSK